MSNGDIDVAHFGDCHACGDEITLQDVTGDEIKAKERQVLANGNRCDRCVEGSTTFAKQVQFQIVQWLGPTAVREQVATVIEPQNASYVVVTLWDGRSARVFRKGESHRELPEEIDHVFKKEFPDLKPMEPWGAVR